MGSHKSMARLSNFSKTDFLPADHQKSLSCPRPLQTDDKSFSNLLLQSQTGAIITRLLTCLLVCTVLTTPVCFIIDHVCLFPTSVHSHHRLSAPSKHAWKVKLRNKQYQESVSSDIVCSLLKETINRLDMCVSQY
jgi:hypothetical protein